jgi:hypothetical protein
MTSNYYWVKVDHRYVWEIGYLMDGDWLLPGVEGKWYPVEIGPPVADISQVERFDECISLLRELADLQNGPPLVTYEEDWNECMAKVYEFLDENEKSQTP